MVVGAGPVGVEDGGVEDRDVEDDGAQTDDRLRGFAIRWVLIFGVLLIAFLGTVLALNSTIYSAHGFVASYLSALSRHDVDAALATPGVAVPEGTTNDLLAATALGDLDDIRLVSDTDAAAGVHRVTYEFDLDGTKAATEFTVRNTGSRLWFFSTWKFETSPTSTLQITPDNAAQFEANGVSVQSANGPSVPVSYGVLTPGVFSLSHDSTYLSAKPESILVLEPGATARANVKVRANPEFVKLVQTELDGLLDDCTTQTVLQPTGCPFGETITNRIEGEPVWSMDSYPAVTIVPGPTHGTWQVPETEGLAHLVVDVRSLFDGTLSRFDQNVSFTVSYLITFPADGSVTITAQ